MNPSIDSIAEDFCLRTYSALFDEVYDNKINPSYKLEDVFLEKVSARVKLSHQASDALMDIRQSLANKCPNIVEIQSLLEDNWKLYGKMRKQCHPLIPILGMILIFAEEHLTELNPNKRDKKPSDNPEIAAHIAEIKANLGNLDDRREGFLLALSVVS